MDFLLSDEQQLLRDMVERFVADRYPAAERATMVTPDEGSSKENWALLAELGLLAMPFDAETAGPVETMVVMETLGRGVVAEPVLSEILMAVGLLARAGTETQKERWLEPIMAGEAHIALAFAESGTRYAFDEARCTCAAGRLNGTKTFVIAGTACDAFIVTARGDDGAIGLFLVEKTTPGLTSRSYRLIDGAPACELDFADVAVEPLALGVEALVAHVDSLRLAICAELVGLMQTLFDTTLEYLKMRQQFGTAIGSFQALQHRMAEQYAALEQSRSHLLRAALTEGEDGPAARLAAKSYIARAAVRLGEEAIQMHGGMGVTDELIVGHAHKRVLLLASLFGDAATETKRYLEATA